MPNEDEFQTSTTLLRQLCDPKNSTAWDTFVERYRPVIVGWCSRHGFQHQDAEEVTSEVLAKLVVAMRNFTYDPARRFRSWLTVVVANAATDYLRKRRSHPIGLGGDRAVEMLNRIADPYADESPVSADLLAGLETELRRDVLIATEARAVVQKRVERHTWRAFEMTAMDGRPGAEVAHELGMTVAAVHMAKSRVLKMLREQFTLLSKSGIPEIGPADDRPA
jgi:RNA polymerase sigma-70 factor (ECF subfamily)